MQTRQKTLSGSTARSEGSPAKYLGIVNISVNKEEMLALLPLASFCTTSRVTVWAMGGAGFKRHKPQSGSPSAACDSPPNLSILLQLPRTCLRWLKLLKTGLIFRSRLLTKSVVLLWRFSIEETNALWEKKKKERAQNINPEFPALWLLSCYPWAGVYFPKDKNIPVLIRQHPGTPWVSKSRLGSTNTAFF